MKNVLKKNQIIISVIAIMLIAAGYMNYTANENQTFEVAGLFDTEQYADIGDARLVSANTTNEEILNTEMGSSSDTSNEEGENKINANTIMENTTNTITETMAETTTANQYFTESRLERDKMYSQMLESYQNILSNSQISESQKEISEAEIKNINDLRNSIMITENLLKNKGFEDLIIFVNGDSINIVIKTKNLTEEQVAQIQNIVSRELNADIENIHISNKE